MNPYSLLQDVYLDAINMSEELKRLPGHCACKDAEAHLSGRCSCAGPHFKNKSVAADEESDCLSCLQKLNRHIEWFEADVHQSLSGSPAGELSRALEGRLSLLMYLIDVLKRTVRNIEADLRAFKLTCAHAALEKLKGNSKELEKYAGQVNQLLGADGQEKPDVQRAPSIDAALSPAKKEKKVVFDLPAEDVLGRLKELGEKHSVCYEVWPESLSVEAQPVKVGFELELYGTHDHGRSTLTPGCDRCVETFNDLRQIAEWIIPPEERDSVYDIQPFDNAIRELPAHRLRPEVVLMIKILHKHGFDKPVDACEESCLKEMQKKLAQLGIRRGR